MFKLWSCKWGQKDGSSSACVSHRAASSFPVTASYSLLIILHHLSVGGFSGISEKETNAGLNTGKYSVWRDDIYLLIFMTPPLHTVYFARMSTDFILTHSYNTHKIVFCHSSFCQINRVVVVPNLLLAKSCLYRPIKKPTIGHSVPYGSIFAPCFCNNKSNRWKPCGDGDTQQVMTRLL